MKLFDVNLKDIQLNSASSESERKVELEAVESLPLDDAPKVEHSASVSAESGRKVELEAVESLALDNAPIVEHSASVSAESSRKVELETVESPALDNAPIVEHSASVSAESSRKVELEAVESPTLDNAPIVEHSASVSAESSRKVEHETTNEIGSKLSTNEQSESTLKNFAPHKNAHVSESTTQKGKDKPRRDTKKNFVCAECGKEFKLQSSLYNHK